MTPTDTRVTYPSSGSLRSTATWTGGGENKWTSVRTTPVARGDRRYTTLDHHNHALINRCRIFPQDRNYFSAGTCIHTQNIYTGSETSYESTL